MEDSNEYQNSNGEISLSNKLDEESNENLNISDFIEIFSINEKLEEEVRDSCGIPNWGEMIFGLFDLNLRKKLIETSKKNEGYYYFILGITKEYGIDTDIDYELAFSYYQKSANLKECFALYKLYIIYSNQNEIFKLQRNREKEIYFLLQSIAFSDCSFFMNNDTFFKIDIFYEINLIFNLETNLIIKLNNLFANYSNSEDNKDDLLYLQSIITMKFLGEKHNIDVNKQYEIFDKIKILSEDMHLESCYKLAYIFRLTDKNYSRVLFNKLIEKKFTKAYYDYGIFLHSENFKKEALEIFKEGMELGNYRCNFAYYDLFLALLDLEKNYKELIDLSEILIEDILMGNVFSVFDFFFKRKILIKHFKVPIKELNNEFIHDLLKITEKSISNKDLIKNNFSGNIVLTELLLSHGFLAYIGSIGKPDYLLAEKCLKESFQNSKNNSYKRFCYSYIYKIRERRLGYKTQKEKGEDFINEKNYKENLEIYYNNDNFESKYSIKNKLIENDDLIVLYNGKEINKKDKIKKSQKKLFNIYNDSIKNGILEDFSSSFFYYMGKIIECGWGTKIDELSCYCYYIHGRDSKINNLGTGSIISYYRRYKSILKMRSKRYSNILINLSTIKDDIFLKNDEKECFICYENKKDVIFFPCKHMICKICFDKIKEDKRCPTCRSKILLHN